MIARLKRLRGKAAMLAMISAAIVATIVVIAPQVPLVIYNASGSAPLGFYRLENRLPRRGEMAVIQPPPMIELMLVGRGILPASVPLVKQLLDQRH